MSTLSSPEEWLIRALTGDYAPDGPRNVTYQQALTIAYVWEAIGIISGDVASLPLETRRVEADGDRIPDMRHPVYRVLNCMANDWMHAFTLRETMTHYALLIGNAMAFILRDQSGNPTQLIPAVPGELTPELRGNRKVYVYEPLKSETMPAPPFESGTTFADSDIFHVKGLGDGIMGHSVLRLARGSFGLILAQDKHGRKHFERGGKPTYVLKHPMPLSKEKADELLERFEIRHSDDARPALAAGGLEIQAFPSNNSDSQWIESRQQAIVEVAAWFSLPPHKLGDSTRVGYNGVTAENQAYITQTLRRWLKRWETEAYAKLLTERERRAGDVELWHNPRPLLETDTMQLTQEVAEQRKAMIITANEARRRLGYPMIVGGDDLVNPSTTSGGTGPDTPPPAAEPTARAPFVALVAERLDRLAGAMARNAEQRRRQSASWDGWSVTWTERVAEYVAPALTATASVFPCAELPVVTQHVADWATLIQSGEEITPTPAELAEQIVGVA